MTTTLAVRHVVWDWNGTLLDDNDAVLASVNAVCAEFGRDPVELDEWRELYTRPIVRSYERLLGRTLSESDWATLDLRYHDSYRELLHTCRLATGAPEALSQWRAGGKTQSLLSMWFHDELVSLINELRLVEFFARVDGLRDRIGGGSKATHLAAHLAELNLDPAEVVLIGDVLDDARAAAHVGAECVLVATGMTSGKALRGNGYPVADSIQEAFELINARR